MLKGRGGLAALAALALITVAVACGGNDTESPDEPGVVYPLKTNLQEAEKIMGVSLPVPTYLSVNYEISQVEVTEPNRVTLTISPVSGSTANRVISMQIAWKSTGGPFGIKLPGDRVDIRGGEPGTYSGAVIVDRGDHNDLWWDWGPDTSTVAYFEFVLSANKNVPQEELIKIARSVRQP